MLKSSALLLAVLYVFYASKALASPWVGTVDKQLHYDLQTLQEWGYLDATVITYPVPWRGVADLILQLDLSDMADTPKQAAQRLSHYLYLQKQQKRRTFLELQASSDQNRFTSFDGPEDVKASGKISNEFYWGRVSAQLSVNYHEGGNKNLDNSFLAYQFGDWNLRAGAIDQWWGPGQSSSLILSNNARPIPTLAFSRSSAVASKSPWLSWLGPWYLTSQIGRLEDNREVPDTNLLLNRFTFSPIKRLEIGASWAVMWGGQGNPSGFDTLIDVITFQEVCLGRESCTKDELSKAGNHLAGYDIKYSFDIFERPVSIYAQRIGEDSKSGIRITDNANLFGVSTYFGSTKVYLETSDTNISCSGDNDTSVNCFYENGTYTSGYRYYDRVIGSTFDSDAKQITLGSNWRFERGAIAEIILRVAELNADGTRPSPVLTGGNIEDVIQLSGFYQRPFGAWLLKVGGSIESRDLVEGQDERNQVDGVIYFNATYAFD
ncbi:capsule assembly Wzi family protein [Glaciecola sp. MH2013]|nr:capsule assembly Wzi family protein [Glaciecola sp. MH2013]